MLEREQHIANRPNAQKTFDLRKQAKEGFWIFSNFYEGTHTYIYTCARFFRQEGGKKEKNPAISWTLLSRKFNFMEIF